LKFVNTSIGPREFLYASFVTHLLSTSNCSCEFFCYCCYSFVFGRWSSGFVWVISTTI